MSQTANKSPRPLHPQQLELDATQIKAGRRWWLKTSAVRAGDILLIQNPGLQSLGIRFADGSAFSHAALWMHSGEETLPLRLAEADAQGVGFTELYPITLHDKGEAVEVWLLPGHPRQCRLLRHKDASSVPESLAQQVAAEIRKDWFYSDYSPLHRLAEASRHPEAARRLYGALLKGLDVVASKGHGRKTLFCSELVAVYYDRIGLPLFSPPKAPALVSPAVLAQEAQGLHEVKDAFICTATLSDDAVARGLHFDDPRAQGWLPLHVRQARQSYLIDKLDDTLKRSVEEWRQQTLQQYIAAHEAFRHTAAQVGQLAQVANNRQAANKIMAYQQTEARLFDLLISAEQRKSVVDPTGNVLTLNDAQAFYLALVILSLLEQVRFSVWRLDILLLRTLLRGSSLARKPLRTQKPFKLAAIYRTFRQLRQQTRYSRAILDEEIKKSAEALTEHDIAQIAQWGKAHP
ncbi:hypothetical protein ACI09X_000798 [Cronobacter dublinensis]